MSGIVCAIRGGPASKSTIDRALALARETGQPITFVYVLNVAFLALTEQVPSQALVADLLEMGEFILQLACDRARAAGVAADTRVRRGQVVDEIVAVCRALDADYAVLGRPTLTPTPNVFTDAGLAGLARQIEAACQAHVITVA